jgi:hypothetical protein
MPGSCGKAGRGCDRVPLNRFLDSEKRDLVAEAQENGVKKTGSGYNPLTTRPLSNRTRLNRGEAEDWESGCAARL